MKLQNYSIKCHDIEKRWKVDDDDYVMTLRENFYNLILIWHLQEEARYKLNFNVPPSNSSYEL